MPKKIGKLGPPTVSSPELQSTTEQRSHWKLSVADRIAVPKAKCEARARGPGRSFLPRNREAKKDTEVDRNAQPQKNRSIIEQLTNPSGSDWPKTSSLSPTADAADCSKQGKPKAPQDTIMYF